MYECWWRKPSGSQQLDVVIPASKGTDEVGKRIVKSRPIGLGQKDSLKPCVPLKPRWDADDECLRFFFDGHKEQRNKN